MVEAATMRTTRRYHRSKHHLFVEAERAGGNRISPAAPLEMELFEAIQHPSEPVDLDQPPRCPPPDSNTMRDGEVWREMLAGKRREGLGKGMPLRRRVQRSPREKYLFMKRSAPERAVGVIVE